jgi:putative transcriptional regulator
VLTRVIQAASASPTAEKRASGDNTAVKSLRGQLLIAGPGLLDPNFHRTVVLVGEHGEEGAMGVVLNRPSEIPVEEAVPPLAELDGLEGLDGLVYIGGPVQPQAVVVVGEFDEPERAGVPIFGSIGFLPGEVDPAAIGELERARVFAGYAGWGPGQLEAELQESSWIVEPAGPDDVFTSEPEQLWRAVLRRKGGPFAVLALMPDDPRAN